MTILKGKLNISINLILERLLGVFTTFLEYNRLKVCF